MKAPNHSVPSAASNRSHPGAGQDHALPHTLLYKSAKSCVRVTTATPDLFAIRSYRFALRDAHISSPSHLSPACPPTTHRHHIRPRSDGFPVAAANLGTQTHQTLPHHPAACCCRSMRPASCRVALMRPSSRCFKLILCVACDSPLICPAACLRPLRCPGMCPSSDAPRSVPFLAETLHGVLLVAGAPRSVHFRDDARGELSLPTPLTPQH